MINKIATIISQIKNNPSLAESITLDCHLIEDVGLDSLDIIDFLLELEATFELQFDFDELDFSIMQSMRLLIEFIQEQQARSIETC